MLRRSRVLAIPEGTVNSTRQAVFRRVEEIPRLVSHKWLGSAPDAGQTAPDRSDSRRRDPRRGPGPGPAAGPGPARAAEDEQPRPRAVGLLGNDAERTRALAAGDRDGRSERRPGSGGPGRAGGAA